MTPERYRQIVEIFEAVAEKSPVDREALLAQACAGDDALRREVESMLAADQATGGILEKPPHDLAAERRVQVEDLYRSALEKDPADRSGFLLRACAGNEDLRREVESLLSAAGAASGAVTVTSGTQLGVYRIQTVLGEGGMGVVYRALDTRLNRPVAIKFLSAQLADESARRRFQQEAKTASSLNHPHIVTVHEAGEFEGRQYLVTEFIDGGTLKDWAHAAAGSGSGRTWRQVVELLVGVADGLASAHSIGILHRDIKPANILVGRNGYAKLADFGLAKLAQPAGGESPTRTLAEQHTRAGFILGTIRYMSPEQAAGTPLSARSDIFSFGIVLYEMLAGRPPFEGGGDLEVLQAIRHRAPQPLGQEVPVALRLAVEKALEKDPEDRYQTMRELVVDLRRLIRQSGESSAAVARAAAGSPDGHPANVAPAPPATAGKRVAWIAAGLVAAALSGAFIAWRATIAKPEARPVVRLSIPVAELHSTTPQDTVAVSPDGTRIVYRAGTLPSRLYLHRLDQLQATPIPGTEGASQPFFSPDGQWLGFSTPGKLSKVLITGGEPQTICARTGNFFGADWAADGTIFVGTNDRGIQRVPSSGGTLQEATILDRGDLSHSWPKALPDGKGLLFAIQTNEFDHHIAVESLVTHQRRRLTKDGTRPQYTSSGHLVYMTDRSLLVSPLDLRRLEVTAPPTTVLDNVQTDARDRGAQFALSDSGTLVYVPGTPVMRTLVWVDRQGVATPLKAPERFYEYPRLSPDGQRLAVTIGEAARRDIWIYDLVRDTFSRLTYDGHSTAPEWTPDGNRLVFGSTRDGQKLNLYLQAADGTGVAERLLVSDKLQYAGSWSPDGGVLAFAQLHPKTGWDTWLLPLAGEHQSRAFLELPGSQFGPRISPDGRWLAYVSNAIYVTSFPSGNGKWQVSTGGGSEAVWARNGLELFYKDGKNMMAVAIDAKSSFTAMKARLLFSREGPRFPGVPQYDVSLDGRRFLMIDESESPATAQLNVVLNWSEELKNRFHGPARK